MSNNLNKQQNNCSPANFPHCWKELNKLIYSLMQVNRRVYNAPLPGDADYLVWKYYSVAVH